MRVLTINCGSSSVKFALFEVSRALIARAKDRGIIRGNIERVGGDPSILTLRLDGDSHAEKRTVQARNHEEAIQIALETIEEKSPGEISAVGHRVVHGGPDMGRSRIIDEEVEQAIEKSIDLAPLHNPHNLTGIRAVKKILPNIPNVSAFDTGFHRTIPDTASVYAIPNGLARKYSLHRYGFHGLSHRFLVFRMEQLLKRNRRETNLVTCHLGNGCSMTAVLEGRSVDTTMGFTPCEGLIMGTRPGDIDPGALLYLMERESMTIGETESFLNRQCGLVGLSGISNDMRELFAARASGNELAVLAIDAFCYRLKKYFGAYAAVLEKLDGVVFTGGIGEHSPEIRARALEGLRPFGLVLDPGRNEEVVGQEGKISSDESSVEVWVVPTDEERVIARDTARCVEDMHQAELA